MSFDLDEHFHPWEVDNSPFPTSGPHWVRKSKRDGAIYFHAYMEGTRAGECWTVTLTDFVSPTHLHRPNLPPFALSEAEAKAIAETYYRNVLGIPESAFTRLLDFEL